MATRLVRGAATLVRTERHGRTWSYGTAAPDESQTILGVFAGSCGLAIAAFVAHRRLAGTGERAGCTSMVAFVAAWIGILTALITGAFLLSLVA
jgi:hypothetical protein